MWQFIKAMFFAGSFLLTPTPVNITSSWLEIHLKDSVEALNSGATLEIDVTSIVPPTKPGGHDVVERLARTEESFPKGCVEARLTTKDQREVLLTNVSSSTSSTQTFLLLSKPNGMPIDLQFATLFIRASCPIMATQIYWRNSGM